MRVEILIVTYAKDIPYLVHNLRSILKFASGFSGTTLVVPNDEYKLFYGYTGTCKVKHYERTEDRSKWQIHAQVQKCMADKYCPDADFILHTDSDCIFTEPVTPNDYFLNEKPVMLIEEYSRLKGDPWKATVDKALEIDAKYETMRRHPQVNPRSIYPLMRLRVQGKHKMSFEQYVLNQRGEFPFGFSEHNTIGAYALEFFPYMYHWIDLAKEKAPKEKLRQYWSHSPPDKPQGTPHDKDQCIPLQEINRILA